MKLPKFLLLLFMLTFSYIYCEDRRKLLAEKINNYLSSLNKPKDAKELIDSFEVSTMILCKTLTLNEIDEMQIKFGLSNSITEQLKLARYVQDKNINIIEESNQIFRSFEGEKTLGATINENDGKISFALIKANSLAKLKTRYKIKCKIVFLFKKCENVLNEELTENEKNSIKKAVEFSVINLLIKGTEILKRDDYELYMNAPGSIFSPDKKSVMHLTYFGDIAIGPVSELNAVLPVNFRYKEYEKGKYKRIGNYTKFEDYPRITSKYNEPCDLTINNGLINEFHFLINMNVPKFPRNYVNYIEEKSKKGPYIFEVKKNGNVILYEEKTNKTVWQTNTANKGTGPYNFYLSNDRELILQDSNKNIIYRHYVRSDELLPTIYYATKKKDKHIYSGRILEFGINKFNPLNLDIYSNNDKLNLTYEIKIQETGNWYEYNGEEFYPQLNQGNYYINGFSAMLKANDDEKEVNTHYSICYTLLPFDTYWTPVGCDGERIEMKKSENGQDFFTKFIIFVRADSEDIPIKGQYLGDYLNSINN